MRRSNYRLVKIHRSYTTEEAARVCRVHRNTVRHWIKEQGLPICDSRRPILILGRDLSEFLHAQRRKVRRTCALHEIYCLRCRTPRTPALPEYVAAESGAGNFTGLCPTCSGLMCKRTSKTQLDAIRRVMDVRERQPAGHIVESGVPCLNSHFKDGSDDGPT